MTESVVVIGSGPSGASAALTLLQQGIPVTLLESGRAYSPGLVVRAFGRNLFRKWARTDDVYEYTVSGDPETKWHNGLTPGGLSNLWTGAVPRFAPEDFFEGERLHERYRWPVLYAELESFYTRAEQLLGVVGERRAIPQVSPNQALIDERQLPRTWADVALRAEQSGHGLMYYPVADGARWLVRRSGAGFNSFEQIVAGLARLPNFTLRLGAHAQRLTWNRSRGGVDGVEFVDRETGTIEHLPAAAVVVAAGPIASPKLLMQSTSDDFPSGLGNSEGVLGRYLHDHPKDWCILELDRPLERLDQPLYLSRAPYAESAPLMGAQQVIGPLSKWDRVLNFVGARTNRFGLVTFGTMQPEFHNQLRLHPDKRDEFGMPLLDIDIRFNADVDATIASSHERLLAILEHAGIRGRLECPVPKLAPGWAAHYGGGARMHASPRYGVLDGWNRVHEVGNVAVVDASSFTTGVEKNPTLTAMALAMRAAERLAADLKSGGPSIAAQPANAIPTLR